MKELSQNILDIVQNSIRANANEISIEISESEVSDKYIIKITDNGNGIPDEILDKVTDPFVTTRTRRKLGLGLAILKYHAELTGGSLNIKSASGFGTEITACFSLNHIDRQPLGDLAGVIKILIAANQSTNFIYRHSTDKGEFRFSSAETKEFLEVETLYDYQLLNDIVTVIEENMKFIEVSGMNFLRNELKN